MIQNVIIVHIFISIIEQSVSEIVLMFFSGVKTKVGI